MAKILNVVADKVEYLNSNGLFTVALFVFVLMFCTYGIEKPMKDRMKQAVRELISAENWIRAFHIMRGRAIRSSHRMRKRLVRILNACDYAAARFYLNMVDREARHMARLEEERQKNRKRIYRRVRRKIYGKSTDQFVERYFITLQK